ncbi:MAG: hypothetical protein Q9185_005810 [Variospora sp. 1 TL-2023]
MPQPPAPSSLRILCFGASITAGYHSFGLAPPHPYAHRLQQLLTAALPASTKITVSIDAVPGDRIINGNYTSRLRKHFPLPPSSSSSSSYPSTSLAAAAAAEEEERQQQQDDEKKAKVPSSSYDWIILQAGGNDLTSSSSSTHSSSSSPAAIFAALKQLWRICTADGATTQVLALTVTETSSAQESKVTRDRYAALNAMIRDAAAAAAAEGREKENNGVWVADVEREVPYWGMEAGERRRVWDDGLHLTPRGYDLLGEKVGARLLEILRGQGGREERRERL